MILLEHHDQLDLDQYRRVVSAHETIAVAPVLMERVDEGRRRMELDLAAGASAYGVSTGLGYLGSVAIEPADARAFQASILRRGAGHDPPLPSEVVRGAMLLRLVGFLSGWVGVTPALCRLLVDRLNDGWLPVVPSRGISSAGEVIALSHLFGTLVGEGEVLEAGEPVPARRALAARGAAAYEPDIKEGIALVNGAPLAPALALWLAERARRLLGEATVAGALVVALTGGSMRPFSPRIGALKGDPGQRHVHQQLGELLAGGADFRDAPQGPVSFRVLPQVHGAVVDLLDHLDAQLERELRAVTDSPLHLPRDGDEPEGFYPSGNFHAQALSFLLDASAIALTQVGNLSERRLHRLLDRRFSGLTDQLAIAPGRQTGLVFAHKSAIGMAVENRILSAPASVHPLDTSAGQEDVQALALLAAEKLHRVLDNVELIVSSELLAIRQAHHLSDVALSPRLQRAVQRLAAAVPPIEADRRLTADVDAIRELVRAGALGGFGSSESTA